MGCRTHIGIFKTETAIEYVYGHWRAPLHRGGADILRGELEGYERVGYTPKAAFKPSLTIECVYLLCSDGWYFKLNDGTEWQSLTRDAILADLEKRIDGCERRDDTSGAEYYQEELERVRAMKISPLVAFPPDLPKFD